jgi:hypothetical protein
MPPINIDYNMLPPWQAGAAPAFSGGCAAPGNGAKPSRYTGSSLICNAFMINAVP